jgi:hypothetical protein
MMPVTNTILPVLYFRIGSEKKFNFLELLLSYSVSFKNRDDTF